MSGYLHPNRKAIIGDTIDGQSHAWVQAWTGGWWNYDPTNDADINEQYISVGVGRVSPLASVGVAQDAQPLGVGGHDAVLDAVVGHLDEVPGPARPAVQVALLGGAARLQTWRRLRRALAGRDGQEDRLQPLHDRVLAADHQAVAAIQAPYAAAGADVHVMDAVGLEFLGPDDVRGLAGPARVPRPSVVRCGYGSSLTSLGH